MQRAAWDSLLPQLSFIPSSNSFPSTLTLFNLTLRRSPLHSLISLYLLHPYTLSSHSISFTLTLFNLTLSPPPLHSFIYFFWICLWFFFFVFSLPLFLCSSVSLSLSSLLSSSLFCLSLSLSPPCLISFLSLSFSLVQFLSHSLLSPPFPLFLSLPLALHLSFFSHSLSPSLLSLSGGTGAEDILHAPCPRQMLLPTPCWFYKVPRLSGAFHPKEASLFHQPARQTYLKNWEEDSFFLKRERRGAV